ncbi:MAG: response regulator [Lachnospiraceae bacterium]
MSDKIILVVDDEETNRILLKEIFQDKYTIVEAVDGKEALAQIERLGDSLVMVLLDIIMPNMDGFQVLEILKKREILSHIPVILITGDTSADAEIKGYEYGVPDVIVKPFNSYVVQKRVQNTIDLYHYQDRLEHMVREQTKVLQAQSKQLRETNTRIIDTMSTIVEFRNMESGEHIKRIKGLTKILAACVSKTYPQYKLTEEKVSVISEASAMHDIGKIVIPDQILLKPAKLTTDEFEIMKSHTTKGCEIIKAILKIQNKRYMDYSYAICRYHHERYDGQGYPDKLSGDEIPIAAQIVSVADVYDALVSKRVYKQAYDKEKAYQMILNGECGIFSPQMLHCLELVKDRFEILADGGYAECRN